MASKIDTKTSKKPTNEKWIVSKKKLEKSVMKEDVSDDIPIASSTPSKKKRKKQKKSPKKPQKVANRVTRSSGSKQSSPEPSPHLEAAEPEPVSVPNGKRKASSEDDDEDVFVKPIPVPEPKRKRKASPEIDDHVFAKPTSISAAMVKIAALKNRQKSRPAVKAASKPTAPKQRRARGSRSDTQAWDWAEVLLTNPEKMLRKK